MPARRPALGFIFVTLVLDIVGIGIVVPILPKLVEHYQGAGVAAASQTYGLLYALYGLMQFLFAPLLGNLSDRFGRRPVILISLLGSGLDYFVIAYAPNLTWFVVGRIVAGITASNFAAATAYIADISPPEKRAANFGMIGAAFGLGFIIGPAIGGMLANLGMKVPFFVAGTLTLLNCAYGWLVLPESLAPENRRALNLKKCNPAGALLALKRFPALLGLMMMYFICVMAHTVYPATWVLYTSYRYGWTSVEVGLSLALVGVMAAVVQGGLTRVVVGKIGEARTLRYGLVMTAGFYLAYGLAEQAWMIYVCIILGSLGGLVTPAAQGLMSRKVPPDEQGSLQGTLTSVSSVAGIIGPVIATTTFGYFVSDNAPVRVPGAAFFLSSLLMLMALAVATGALRNMNAEKADA